MAVDTPDHAAEARAKLQTEDSEAGRSLRPMRADDHSDSKPAVETPVEARQGFKGKPVLIVLVTALVLAVVAGIALGYIPL